MAIGYSSNERPCKTVYIHTFIIFIEAFLELFLEETLYKKVSGALTVVILK